MSRRISARIEQICRGTSQCSFAEAGGSTAREATFLLQRPTSSSAPALSGGELTRTSPIATHGPVEEINQHCIAALVKLARSSTDCPHILVRSLRQPLSILSTSAARQIARHPFLLLDMKFGDPSWWVRTNQSQGQAFSGRSGGGPFPRKSAIHLTRMSLTFAWHGMRTDPLLTQILVGCPKPVSEAIGALRLSEIDAIAERQFSCLRIRWEDRPLVWRQLLQAAESDDQKQLSRCSLRSMQLLTSNIVNF